MLSVSSVRVLIGDKPVLDGLSMSVTKNEIVCLIGAPGCGKSTLLHAIFGLARVVSGQIHKDEKDITHASPREHIKNGIVLVPQGGRVFRGLSVEDNLYLGGSTLEERRTTQRIAAIYELFPRLKERRKQIAGSLSGGERQMLALGMGLVPEPTLMLLDEPSTGLSPSMTEVMLGEIKSLIGRLDCTMVVVEQNVKNALFVGNQVLVLRRGRIEHTHHVAQNSNLQDLLDAYSFERNAEQIP